MKPIDAKEALKFYPKRIKFASSNDFFAIYGDKQAAIFDIRDMHDPKIVGDVYEIKKSSDRYILDLQISKEHTEVNG